MMNRLPSIDLINRKTFYYALAIVFGVLALVSTQDWIQSQVKGHSFYLNESLLFNSFWLCFIPIGILGQKLQGTANHWRTAVLVVVSAAFHLLLYPFLVFILSSILFDYTYTFNKVLLYGLSKYVYITLLGYSLLYVALGYRMSVKQASVQSHETASSIKTIALSKGVQKVLVNTADIISIQAESPYIKIITSTERFLHSASLKSMQGQLDEASFVRVHKSSIVNLSKVTSLKSRLNGDYDITMEDDTVVRLSRNYAAEFKRLFK